MNRKVELNEVCLQNVNEQQTCSKPVTRKKRLLGLLIAIVFIGCSVLVAISIHKSAVSAENQAAREEDDSEQYGVFTSGFWPYAYSNRFDAVIYLYNNGVEFEYYTVGFGDLKMFSFIEDCGVLGKKTEWCVWYDIESRKLHNCCFRLLDCTNDELIELMYGFFTVTQPEIYEGEERLQFANYVWRSSYTANMSDGESKLQNMNLVVHCDYSDEASPYWVHIHYDNDLGADYVPSFYTDCYSEYYADYSQWQPN